MSHNPTRRTDKEGKARRLAAAQAKRDRRAARNLKRRAA